MPLRIKKSVRPFAAAPRERKPVSRRWLWGWVVLLLILAIAAGLFDFPALWNRAATVVSEVTPVNFPRFEPRPFRLGLDLVGGSELVYEADLSNIPNGERGDAMEGVRDVIERRVNALGVAEPVVQVVRAGEAYRVVVQLAGVSDIKNAIAQIGETPVLEFKELPSQNPELQSTYQAALAAAQGTVDTIRGKLIATPRISFTRLAESVDLKAEDLGFISKLSHPVIWSWANDHGVGSRTNEPLDASEGWYFIEVVGARQTDKEFEASHMLICYQGANSCSRDTSKEDARREIEALKVQATRENFAELAKQNSTEPAAATSGGSLGWFGPGQMVPPFETAVRALAVGAISEVVETEFGFHIIYKTGERPLKEFSVRQIFLAKPPAPPFDDWVNTGLSGKHLTRARVEFDPNTGQPIISLIFNDEGKQRFGDLTARNVGRPIAIFLDGALIANPPVVQQEIRTGTAIITGAFTIPEAKQYAQRLNAGALPVPIHLVSQQTVGATLGQESLEKSFAAGLIGFVLVALFMVLYYRIPGLLSVVALGIYATFLLALFKFIPVTLTLAGIAGFILSLGMAVDANVLIFERMREELQAGRTLSSAIDEGFRRAWTSIRDGNLTTLISAAALFWFSSSVIKGFALTLGIGVLLSMFSALLVTRALLQLISAWSWKTRLGFFAPFVRRVTSNQ